MSEASRRRRRARRATPENLTKFLQRIGPHGEDPRRPLFWIDGIAEIPLEHFSAADNFCLSCARVVVRRIRRKHKKYARNTLISISGTCSSEEFELLPTCALCEAPLDGHLSFYGCKEEIAFWKEEWPPSSVGQRTELERLEESVMFFQGEWEANESIFEANALTKARHLARAFWSLVYRWRKAWPSRSRLLSLPLHKRIAERVRWSNEAALWMASRRGESSP